MGGLLGIITPAAISTADGKVAIPANASLIVVARHLDAKSGLSELGGVSTGYM